MNTYIIVSLETHLFFARIMKEHAFFLLAAFPSSETGYIKEADWYREQFEKKLEEVVNLANGSIGANGIISCNIRSVILPLLADHVLREANHYLRLLEG